MTPEQQVVSRCKEILEAAGKLYNLDTSKVVIRFDLRGRSAGQAYCRGTEYGMRFNRDMLTREAFDHVFNNSIPHEIAHIVCFMNRTLGKNHDAGWEKVCIALGGSGETHHSEKVVYGKGATYEYITTNGKEIRVSQQLHARIQRGVTYTLRRNMGSLNISCTYKLVGVAGRTLATPVQPKAPVTVATPTVVITTTPKITQTVMPAGVSKAAMARSIMLAGHNRGHSYEEIVLAIMQATGHDRQLSRATYKANFAKVGVPAP